MKVYRICLMRGTRMTSRTCTVSILIAFMVIFTVRPATAETTKEILSKLDGTLTNVKDQSYDVKVQVDRNGKIIKSFEFHIKLKGITMKLAKFTAPGDVRGMLVLTTEEGHTYVYLPSYKRIRRVASHVRNQGFMGTDISPDDMGATTLSEGWDTTLDSEDDKHWIMTLVPLPDNKVDYSKLRITALKKYSGVSKIEYYSRKGKHVKTQIREEWKSFGPITLPMLYTTKNLQTGSVTTMQFSNCKINMGLPKSAFTKRAILRAD